LKGWLLFGKKFIESTLYLSQAVEIDSTFSQALLYLTVAQAWINDNSTYPEAKTTVNKLMRNNKGLNQIQIYLAEGAYAIIYNDIEMAMAASNNLIKKFPDSKWGYYIKAEAFFRKRDFINTLEPLEKVIYLDPELKMAYIHLFEVYYFERLYDRGIDLANQYNQKFPKKQPTLQRKAYTLRENLW